VLKAPVVDVTILHFDPSEAVNTGPKVELEKPTLPAKLSPPIHGYPVAFDFGTIAGSTPMLAYK
jgi:hypothetical protein